MFKWIQSDERSELISGKISFIFLGLTQAGIFIAIFYQRYVMGRAPDYYNDLAILFGISVIGYWLFSLYLGGVLPALSIRLTLAGYLFLVLMIGLPHTIIRGFPEGNEWIQRALIIFGGPAILVGGYSLVAALGKRRLDRLMKE